MATEWQFEDTSRDGRASWSWRCLVDGAPETISARAFAELGLAVHDAIIQGFQPRKHRWLTITRLGVIHFHPGEIGVPSRAPSGKRVDGESRVAPRPLSTQA